MKSLIIRGLSGAIFSALLIFAILYGEISFGILFAIITGLAVNEFCNIIAPYKKTTFSTYLAVLGGVYLFFATYITVHFEVAKDIQLLVFTPYIFLIINVLIIELYRKEGGALNNYAFFVFSQLYTAVPFALLNILATDANGNYCYIFPLVLFIFLWSNDTGAFFVGCSIGRHRMFERISPKKSWEGFVGGAVTTLLAGYIVSQFFDILNVWEWIGMAAVVVAGGTMGDLIESCIKREIGIKDSGNIMPGHGGVLDRFDSTILAIPAVIIYLTFIS
ncbi:MAG: phosphatidate cytidylyltransferase [Bacteroidaceae bacterium]|nr:phosphatidate cytidylyltransferase [Bacteroidaceae bacterium]